MATLHELTELVSALGEILDLFGVFIIVIGIIIATVRFLWRELMPISVSGVSPSSRFTFPYRRYKLEIGMGLLLGLEVLVAADIVKTVALDHTFENLGALAALVAIRTFLSWALIVELEGQWPWNHKHQKDGLI